jgi:hypothetical protein
MSRNTKHMLEEIRKNWGPTKVKGKKLPFFKCGKELKDRVDNS